MDRTSRLGLFLCLILLIGIQFTIDKIYPTIPAKPKHVAAAVASPSTATPATTASSSTSEIKPASATATPALPPVAPVEEKISVLENDAIKVTFTSADAAIKTIELKQYKADEGGNILLNAQARSNVLALSGWPGADVAGFQVRDILDGLAYTSELPGGVKWERTYAFGHDEETHTGLGGYLRLLFHKIAVHLGQPESKPLVYTLNVTDTLTNSGTADVTLPGYSLSVGRADPLRVHGHYQSISDMYLGSGWFTQKFHLTTISDFNPSSFLWIVPTRSARMNFSSKELEDAPLHWIGVENQFFTVLLTPSTDHPIQHGEFQCFNQRDLNGYIVPRKDAQGYIVPGDEPNIEAAAHFPEVAVHAGQSVTLSYGIYAGPKDYNRLDSLGGNQGELMNYDGILPFSLLIVPMLTILHFWYLIFHNYGIAIILLTLMIKAITWPLVSISNRSGKRMQALAPKIKEVQAKYKDQPEKLQTETFALYSEYGVNPMAGCLPALVQMPVFFSLYFMLMNAVELRGQSFLWVHDLTQPDTIWSCALPAAFFGISHFALNPLPIMVTGLTMVMMRLTPQIGDPQQAKIAQWMPLVFLFIFYNFAAALSLYYVINNCVSIIQIYRNLKKPMPELVRKPRKKK